MAAAKTAAPAWGLDPVDVSVLSLSENAVCTVELSDGRRLVLRLHRPGYNTIAELDSEVRWVAALADAGVRVPRPIRSLEGPYYVPVDVGSQIRQVGVIEWVDGSPLGTPLGAADPEIISKYERIGEVAAQIRSQSRSWDLPTGFNRRRWDRDGLVGESPVWGRFWEVDALSEEQRVLFSDTRRELVDVLGSLSTAPDRFGLIHADLHLGNLMLDDETLTVIDFDDAGFGWYSHELAVALHPMVGAANLGEAKDALVSGYRRVHPLDEQEVKLIDVFLVVRSLMLIGWLDARPELPVYEHFGDLAAEAEMMAKAYLDGAP